MNKKKKILYIMHVPWGWIKQRPHFLAEQLVQYFDVDILYKKPFKVRRTDLLNIDNNFSINIKNYFIIPFYNVKILKRLEVLNLFNDILLRIQLGNLKNYDYVWYTDINGYFRFKRIVDKRIKIIYDCMDDDFEFGHLTLLERQKLLKKEKILLSNANMVLSSADYLKRKMIARTGTTKEILTINNALELPIYNQDCEIPENIKEIITKLENLSNVFMYIGTISEWFDFETVIYSLEQNVNANFVLIGPKDIEIPNHKRLHYFGTIERKFIFLIMPKAKALVMSFKLNELIKSVNPVKLYEYIFISKPILAIMYEESSKFDDYVYLYQDKHEYSEFCSQIIDNKIQAKNTYELNRKFATENTWNQRIVKVISKMNI